MHRDGCHGLILLSGVCQRDKLAGEQQRRAGVILTGPKPAETTVEMRRYFKTSSRIMLAALLTGGLLLAFVAAHGCDAKGTSPAGEGAKAVAQH